MPETRRIVDLDRVVISHDVSMSTPAEGGPRVVLLTTRLGEHSVEKALSPREAMELGLKLYDAGHGCLPPPEPDADQRSLWEKATALADDLGVPRDPEGKVRPILRCGFFDCMQGAK